MLMHVLSVAPDALPERLRSPSVLLRLEDQESFAKVIIVLPFILRKIVIGFATPINEAFLSISASINQ